MQQWTDDQKRVIAAPEKRVICAAAAGSGKTAVMIERIVRMIREGADPFSFLVITFTNAAAAEMKEKIRKRLIAGRSDPRVASAAEKAGIMEVCTIHSFCQHLIRQEFQIAKVDPLFRICSAAQRDRLFEDAFHEACDRLRAEAQPDYLLFTERYEPSAAREIVRTVYEFIMSLPKPMEWLREKADTVPLDFDRSHPWFMTVSEMLKEKTSVCRVLLRRQLEMFDEYEKIDAYRKVFLEDSERVDTLRRWTEGENLTREELDREFCRLPACRNLNDREIDWKERYNRIRGKLKDEYEEMRSLILTDRTKIHREFTGIRTSLKGLAALTEETYRCFEKNKAARALLDFSDLEHKALEILQDGRGRVAVRERYRYIFVDECQDVSSIQDELIQQLSGNETDLFMVGDVKQSIYRFRQARPKLFLDRMTEKREEQVCLHLQENFRSRPEILETANQVFRDLMRPGISEVVYTPEEELHPGRKNCPGKMPVQVFLSEAPEGMKAIEAAARQTAEEILRLWKEEKVEYRDIVILMPEVSTDGPVLTEILNEYEIPVFFDGQNDYFQRPEIDAFRNLLELLDNPRLDLPLLTVLKNPPFDMTEEELGQIRIGAAGRDKPFWQAFGEAAEKDTPLGEKCRRIRERLDEWRFLSRHRPLGDFCWFLMEEAGLYAVYGASEHGRSAQRNIRNFCLQAARAQENGLNTLREFLDHLSEQEASGEMRAASLLGDEDQVVRVMTIHKSKGLQFPVVFCLGLDRKNVGVHPAQIRLDEELGLCLNYKVPEYRLSRATVAEKIFSWKSIRQVKAEKICLLYVAMTRAQERLYLVGSKTDDTLWHLNPGDYRTASAETYLDWLMPSLLDPEKNSTAFTQPEKPWKITILEPNQQENVEKPKVFHNLQTWLDPLLASSPVEDLWKEYSGTAAGEDVTAELKKYSVTALLRDARERLFMEEEEQTPEEKRTPEYVRKMMNRYRTEKRPAFMRAAPEATGAQRGSVIHRFLSLVDLEQMKVQERRGEALAAAVRRMCDEQVFTPEEASWIRTEKIERFLASPIGRRLLAGREIHREWDFNLYVPERDMILQGMIDCAFLEEEGWILLDYKTDRIEDEEAFVEEYRPQLAWYRIALEKLTGTPVAESWLYSLSTDRSFRL